MSKKQTSIEWLIEQLPIRVINSLQEEIAKADAMHKEEIIKAFDEGQEYEYQYHINSIPKLLTGEQYYTQTYEEA